VRNLLTGETAERLYACLTREVPWGLAYNDRSDYRFVSRAEGNKLPPEQRNQIQQGIFQRAQQGLYQYVYNCYPILDAYMGEWHPGLYLNPFFEFLNSEPMLNLIRTITGIPEIIKGDAQATLYAPNHFLGLHTDEHKEEGWRVAYIINMTREWREGDGGYLLFYDEDGDVVQGFKPRFNALNMFAVPQRHAVSFVPPYARPGRLAITGWFRDR